MSVQSEWQISGLRLIYFKVIVFQDGNYLNTRFLICHSVCFSLQVVDLATGWTGRGSCRRQTLCKKINTLVHLSVITSAQQTLHSWSEIQRKAFPPHQKGDTKLWCLLLGLQDADFDSQSQSSYDRALSERGHSQMSSDDTWKGKPNASEYTHTHTYSKLKFNLKIFFF